MYACCKHGPAHRRLRCGFAHVLGDVALPPRIENKYWRDKTEFHRGPAGIDMFFGQTYTVFQLERILTLVYSEPFALLPSWARQLVWFLRLRGCEHFIADGDFGMAERVDYLKSFGESVLEEYPFEPLVDSRGLTLRQRMRDRFASAVSSPIVFLYSAMGFCWIC